MKYKNQYTPKYYYVPYKNISIYNTSWKIYIPDKCYPKNTINITINTILQIASSLSILFPTLSIDPLLNFQIFHMYSTFHLTYKSVLASITQTPRHYNNLCTFNPCQIHLPILYQNLCKFPKCDCYFVTITVTFP